MLLKRLVLRRPHKRPAHGVEALGKAALLTSHPTGHNKNLQLPTLLVGDTAFEITANISLLGIKKVPNAKNGKNQSIFFLKLSERGGRIPTLPIIA